MFAHLQTWAHTYKFKQRTRCGSKGEFELLEPGHGGTAQGPAREGGQLAGPRSPCPPWPLRPPWPPRSAPAFVEGAFVRRARLAPEDMAGLAAPPAGGQGAGQSALTFGAAAKVMHIALACLLCELQTRRLAARLLRARTAPQQPRDARGGGRSSPHAAASHRAGRGCSEPRPRLQAARQEKRGGGPQKPAEVLFWPHLGAGWRRLARGRDRWRGGLMASGRFDGYHCIKKKKKSPDWFTVDLKPCQLKPKRQKSDSCGERAAGSRRARDLLSHLPRRGEDKFPLIWLK